MGTSIPIETSTDLLLKTKKYFITIFVIFQFAQPNRTNLQIINK